MWESIFSNYPFTFDLSYPLLFIQLYFYSSEAHIFLSHFPLFNSYPSANLVLIPPKRTRLHGFLRHQAADQSASKISCLEAPAFRASFKCTFVQASPRTATTRANAINSAVLRSSAFTHRTGNTRLQKSEKKTPLSAKLLFLIKLFRKKFAA